MSRLLGDPINLCEVIYCIRQNNLNLQARKGSLLFSRKYKVFCTSQELVHALSLCNIVVCQFVFYSFAAKLKDVFRVKIRGNIK